MMEKLQKTKVCPHCQSEIPKKAKVCPNCRRSQGGGCFRITMGVLIGFIILIVLISIMPENKESEEPNKNAQIKDNRVVLEANNAEDTKREEPVMFKPKEIYSKNKCKFLLAGGNKNGFTLEIKNNSKKDYDFDVHSMSINGIMTNCNIYTAGTDVPSKKKGVMDVEFESEWLKGIDNVEYVDFIIWAYDNAKSYKDFETEIIRIKSNKFTKEKKYNGNKDSKKLNGIIVQKENLDTEEFVFSVINKNDYFIEFDFNNSSINGWAFDSDYLFDVKRVYVYPNSITTVKLDLMDFSEHNKIKKIKNIEFSLGIREKGDYFKETETKKIRFKQ